MGATRLVVDLSIAIVVDAIADLCDRRDLSGARRPLACGLADAFARLTGAASKGRRRRIVTGLSLTDLAFADLVIGEVVDLAIAIIVDAVADLGGSGSSITSEPLAERTNFFACVTTTLTGAADIVIDASVAIVVLVVASLSAGEALAVTRFPFSGSIAGLTACFAMAHALGIARAAVTIAALVGGTFAAFVDISVAIVVDAIAADLCFGQTGITGFKLAVDADLIAKAASCLTAALDFIVDLAVAIVVFAVALLDLRKLLLGAFCPHAIDADLRAIATLALLSRCGSACVAALFVAILALAAFINLSIAIVIESVTFFGGCGENLACAGCKLSVSADLNARFTSANSSGSLGAVVTRFSFTFEAFGAGGWADRGRVILFDASALCAEGS